MTYTENVAKIAHEVNRAYCASNGDLSQPTWESAPDWQKQSALQGVLFHQQNPDADASASHENWLRVKLADGWKWGPVKDPATKEHPCCVPFDQLPHAQQVKDWLFRAVVHAAAGMGK